MSTPTTGARTKTLPQPIEPSLKESVRPQRDSSAPPFQEPEVHETAPDVSPGTRKAAPVRPRQPSRDSIARAEDEGMTPPPSHH